MPIVKHIAIHTFPKAFIKYILNGDKNSDMKYASAINSTTDIENAYKMFEKSFERFTHEKFFKYSVDKAKEKIRLHHYIQSFDPKENITPEKAHEIGLEWARKTFGTNHDRQIICSTHIDKGHIHNHFAVAPFSQSGKQWIDNMKTLNQVRKISDEICVRHGVSIIENPNKHGGIKYKEWIEKKKNSSWKDELKFKIDNLIVSEHIKDLDNLFKALEDDGDKTKIRWHTI